MLNIPSVMNVIDNLWRDKNRTIDENYRDCLHSLTEKYLTEINALKQYRNEKYKMEA